MHNTVRKKCILITKTVVTRQTEKGEKRYPLHEWHTRIYEFRVTNIMMILLTLLHSV